MPDPACTCTTACSSDSVATIPAGDATRPHACDLSALPATARATHEARATQLLASAQTTQELPDGYTFRYPPAAYPQVVEFIANERYCCPFFTFGLTVPAGATPLELRITGAPGVNDLLQGALRVRAALGPTHP